MAKKHYYTPEEKDEEDEKNSSDLESCDGCDAVISQKEYIKNGGYCDACNLLLNRQ